MTDERKAALRTVAQTTADRLRRTTKVSFAVVLLSEGDVTIVGAQVPELEVLANILRGALARIEDQTARIIDNRERPP